ncbi:hypothetical protein [uncultured Lacinutrix sp.]|uniref:hypothetical protein n=1 Tax=uncultured Lacinutrix sp. TaxID=574032 RepID=UPI00262979DC|nr:hypothetical protein [uncultured Lacinutrix sp.]
MKKQILNLGKALNKVEQKQINGGSACAYYHQYNLCFGPVPGCLPCGRMDDYPGASTCGLLTHASCEGDISFNQF